jgi:glycosyltransferase involved in cell wall biosynthesis
MARRVMVSFSREAGDRLLAEGPRRDLLEVARAADAGVVFAAGKRSRGLLGKALGGHVRQALRTAWATRRGDAVLADGEHTGIPFALAVSLTPWNRPARVVVIGHLVSKPWKLAALGLVSRLGTRGTLVLHSVEQQRLARRWLGSRWRTKLAPYQVDTSFWTPGEAPKTGRPLVVAVGAENRDYGTFLAAVRGLDADVVVAAGSHWARGDARAADLPANVTWLDRPVPFAELREMYRRASVAVVPLADVANQSGVTVILEAMSCGLPVVVTATRGQRECIVGPLLTAASGLEGRNARGRGPSALLGGEALEDGVTGLYVVPGDAEAMRKAIGVLIEDARLATAIGARGRVSAGANFGIERFVETFAAELRGER